MKEATPIQRWLGIEGEYLSPFELLGVSPDRCTEHLIHEALHRRLERLAANAPAASNEADEVRLALHAAAAQLLDPHVRARLVARWGDARPGQAVAKAPRASPPRSAAAGDAVLSFQDAVRRIVAVYGGLNRHSRRMVVAMAHSMGLDAPTAMEALGGIADAAPHARRLTPPRHAPAARPATPTAVPSAPSVYADIQSGASGSARRARQRFQNVGIAAGLVVIVLSLVILILA
ncbi:MAG: hypothetical protein VYC34_07445, partial [Planctomycetota bacterium]|nr:hypothetical protein [Planctomycetota bacterium]